MNSQLTLEKKATKLSYDQQQEAIVMYLGGKDVSEIKKHFNVAKKVIDHALANKEQRTLVEKKHFENTRAKETRIIDELKVKAYKTLGSALTDIEQMEGGRQAYVNEMNQIIDKIDKISRLNRGEATEVTKHTETKEVKDYAAILKELKDATPEQKKAFLSKQQVIEAKAEVIN